MACMTPAAEGTRISIKDPEAVAFRAGIIEGTDAQPSARLSRSAMKAAMSSSGHDRDDRS